MKVEIGKQRFPLWLIVTFVLETIIILFGGYRLLMSLEQRQSREIERQLLAITDMKTKQIAYWRKERLGDGNEVMHSRFLIEGVERWMKTRDKEAADYILARLEALQFTYSYRDAFLVDTNGRVLLSIRGTATVVDDELLLTLKKSNREQQAIICDINFNAAYEAPSMEVIAPLMLPGGSQSAFASIVLVIDPSEYFYPLLKSWPIPSKTSETALIRREDDHVLFLNELQNLSNTAFKLKIPLTQRNVPAVMAVLGQEGVFQGNDYRGVPVLSALGHIPDSPWFIVAKIDREEAFQDMGMIKLLIHFLTFGLLLASIAVTLVFRQQTQKREQKQTYQVELDRLALTQHFQYLIKYANDIILLTDEDQWIKEANDRALEEYGFTREDILQCSMLDFIAPSSRQIFEEKSHLLQQEGSYIAEMTHRRRDGTEFAVEISVRLMLIEPKTYIQAIIRDISERKRAEENLRESESKFVTAFKQSPIAMTITSMANNTYVDVNDLFLKDTGFSRGEIIGHTSDGLSLFADPHDRLRLISQVRQQGFVYGMEIPFRIKSGKILICLISTGIIQMGGKPHLLSSIIDITDRKKAVEALRESEEKFRSLFENSPLGKSLTGLDGSIRVNNAFCSMLGYTQEELNSKNWKEISHPDDIRVSDDVVDSIQKGKQTHARFEKRYIHKNGSIVWVEANTFLQRDPEGKPLYFITTTQNITERKQAEEERKWLQEVIERSINEIYMFDAETLKFKYVNGGALRNLGYSLAEILQMTPLDLKPEFTEDRFREMIVPLLLGQQNLHVFETVHRRADASQYPVEVYLQLVETGEERVFLAVIRDITDRKKAEEETLILKTFRDSLFSSAPEAIVFHDMNDIVMNVNDEFLRMFGYSREEVIGTPVNLLVARGKQQEHAGSLSVRVTQGKYVDVETKRQRKDGTVFDVSILGAPVIHRGNQIGVYAIYRDITERKQMEQNLLREKERLEIASRFGEVALWEWDIETGVLEWSNTMDAMLGYSPGEFPRTIQAWNEILHPDDKARVEQVTKRHLEDNAEYEIDCRGRRRDGTYLWWHVTGSSERNENGKAIRMSGASVDITDRKQGEDKLIASETRYRRLFESAKDGILILNAETGIIVDANPFLIHLLGFSHTEFLGKSIWDIGFFKDIIHNKDKFIELQQKEYVRYEDFPLETSDGRKIDIEFVSNVYLVNNQKVIQCNIRDITDRKQAQEKLRISEKRLSDLNELQGLLLQTNSIEHKLKIVTDAVVQYMGADFARIWMIEPGDKCETGCIHALITEGPHVCQFRDRCLHLMSSSGRYTHTDSPGHGRVPFDCYKIGKIASGEETKFLTNEVTTDPRVHNHVWAQELGLVSFAGYRLVDVNAATLGVLALFSKRQLFDEEDLFLQRIAHATSEVLQVAHIEKALTISEEKYRTLFANMSEGVALHEVMYDSSGKAVDYRILDVNEAFEAVLGIPRDRAIGVVATQFYGLPEAPYLPIYAEVAETGEPKRFESFFPPMQKHFSISIISPVKGRFATIFEDITEQKRASEIIQIRLRLIDYAALHRTDEFLQYALDEVTVIMNSPIGFYHFVEPDQKTLSLQAWSTRTQQEYCKAEAKGMQYSIDQAGVWVECVREGKAVIHNDYETLPNRKGLPEGHAPLIRELVVPIYRSGKIVAILGVGNKPQHYIQKDVELLTHFADVIWEITEHIISEDALRESEALLRQSQASAHIGHYVLDVASGVWTNSVALDTVFGISKEYKRDVQGWLEIIPPDRRDEMFNYLQQHVIAGHHPFNKQYKIIRVDDQQTRWVHGMGELEYNAEGNPVKMFGTIQDITERKEAEEVISRMNEILEKRVKDRTAQLESANKELEAFSYSVSHDLRAPLRGMLGFTQLLLKNHGEGLNIEGKDYLRRVATASEQMSVLIDDLLNLSRITRTEMIREPVDVSGIVHSLVSELQFSHPGRMVEVCIQKGLEAEGDPKLLRIALHNLLENAWKYTRKQEHPKIEFGKTEKDGKTVYYIRDNGVGFDMQYADKLFGAFQRLHSKNEFEGTGVGLATVARIISRHGGKIWAEAKVGEGAVFYFIL